MSRFFYSPKFEFTAPDVGANMARGTAFGLEVAKRMNESRRNKTLASIVERSSSPEEAMQRATLTGDMDVVNGVTAFHQAQQRAQAVREQRTLSDIVARATTPQGVNYEKAVAMGAEAGLSQDSILALDHESRRRKIEDQKLHIERQKAGGKRGASASMFDKVKSELDSQLDNGVIDEQDYFEKLDVAMKIRRQKGGVAKTPSKIDISMADTLVTQHPILSELSSDAKTLVANNIASSFKSILNEDPSLDQAQAWDSAVNSELQHIKEVPGKLYGTNLVYDRVKKTSGSALPKGLPEGSEDLGDGTFKLPSGTIVRPRK